jgi:integrase
MGRYKQNFSLNSRKTKTGKTYWYYRTYTPDGCRTTAKSTGCTSKMLARAFCEDLFKRGMLYNGQHKTFSQYAGRWFDDGSVWLQDRLACGTEEHPALSVSYILRMRSDLNNYLLPYFGSKKLEDIHPSDIKHFRTWMLQEKKLSHKTVNCAVSTLKQITDTALADSVIMYDPLRGIRPLAPNEKKRDAFTIDEAVKIFRAEWKSPETRLVNLVSACTGMRESEVYAINKTNLYPDYIDLSFQVLRGEQSPLKTKSARKIPICKELYDMLFPYCRNGFAFHEVDPQRPYIHLRYVLRDLGMENERINRGLCFHSWRHFFNTYLLSENVSSEKVAAVLGHSSGKNSMQARYTNFKPEQMPEVYEAQHNVIMRILSGK